MVQYNRRHFLQGAAGAVALTLLPKIARADVNSKIRIATIGLNGRGKSHIGGFGENLVALCDCDRNVLGQRASEFERQQGRKIDQVVDYRELLDRKDIDAISIATPNRFAALNTLSQSAVTPGLDPYLRPRGCPRMWTPRVFTALTIRAV